MRKLIIVLVIVIFAALAVYMAFGRSPAKRPEITYISVPVEKGTLVAEVMCTGSLTPLNAVQVGCQVSGIIKDLYVDFESEVKKGQLIALIDPPLFEAKVAQAHADLEAAKANLAKAEVTLKNELRNLGRKEPLFRGGSIPESDLDTARTTADAAKAEADLEKARVAQMEAKLLEADLQLKYTRIVTPVDGVVTSRTIDVGQTVAASFQAPVLFKIAEDLTRMQVYANVDEADVGRVRVGQKAVFTVPAFPEEPFEAAVTQIRNEPKTEQNVVTFIVVLDVDNTSLKLRPGMTANVRILLERAEDALMVPEQALRFAPSTKSPGGQGSSELRAAGPGQKVIWRLGQGVRLQPIVVETGVVGTERVQVLSSELKPGDRVVVDEIKPQPKSPGTSGIRFRF